MIYGRLHKMITESLPKSTISISRLRSIRVKKRDLVFACCNDTPLVRTRDNGVVRKTICQKNYLGGSRKLNCTLKQPRWSSMMKGAWIVSMNAMMIHRMQMGRSVLWNEGLEIYQWNHRDVWSEFSIDFLKLSSPLKLSTKSFAQRDTGKAKLIHERRQQ